MTPTERRLEFNRLFNGCTRIDSDAKIWIQKNGFYSAPASTKYHNAYEGGLFDHSFNVSNRLIHYTERGLCEKWSDEWSPMIIGMFHDLCKIDQYRENPGNIEKPYEWRDTLIKGHADKSIMLLSTLVRLTEEEMYCIRYHMGAFSEDLDEQKRYSRAVEKYPNVLWTHTADMEASHVMEINR